jgi:multiple sugar transport system permease protein
MINNTGTVLTIIPLIILYVFCQKSFVEGIERSGIVG